MFGPSFPNRSDLVDFGFYSWILPGLYPIMYLLKLQLLYSHGYLQSVRYTSCTTVKISCTKLKILFLSF